MKLQLLFFATMLVIMQSCQNAMKLSLDGDYNGAIEMAAKKIEKNKAKEKDIEALIRSVKNSYTIDMEELKIAEASTAPDKWANINRIHQRIKNRQYLLFNMEKFNFQGQTIELPLVKNIVTLEENSREKAGEYYYSIAENKYQAALARNDKNAARQAFTDYNKVNEFFVYYKDKNEHQNNAYFLGSTKVFFNLKNESGKKLPENFEFNVNRLPVDDLNQNWVVYYSEPKEGMKPDYIIETKIKSIVVGPNQTGTRTYAEQINVIDGYRDIRDANGNILKEEIWKAVRAEVQETQRYKEAQIGGVMEYKDSSGRIVKSEPIGFKAVYSNSTAQFRGDQRALSQESIQKIQNTTTNFPTDDEIINYSGIQLQSAIKSTLIQNRALIQ